MAKSTHFLSFRSNSNSSNAFCAVRGKIYAPPLNRKERGEKYMRKRMVYAQKWVFALEMRYNRSISLVAICKLIILA